MTPNAESIYEVTLDTTLLNGNHYGVDRLSITINGTPQDVACVGQDWGKVKDRKARFTSVSWSSFTVHETFSAAALEASTWLAALPTDAATAFIAVDDQVYSIANCALVSASAHPDGCLVRYSVSLRGGKFEGS